MKLRSADWKVFGLWVAGLALAALCIGWVLRTESERQLQQGAAQSALRWAQFASRSVPDLDLAFAGGGISPSAREQLLRLRYADDVFRFQLFDPAGNLILSSDDLDRGVLPSAYSVAQGIGHGAAAGTKVPILDQVLSGKPHIKLVRQTRPGRPSIYSEAYVPVLRDGKLLGVVKVYVDQAGLASNTERAFIFFAVSPNFFSVVLPSRSAVLAALMATRGPILVENFRASIIERSMLVIR